MTHRSLFTYNITRPYPFKWFTPVTIVSGLLLSGLLSWLNYASNGFDMVVSTTSDPNATMADVPVLQRLPSLLTGNFKTKCQPVSLTINSRFFTSHNGLQYEILEIGEHRVGNDIPGFRKTLPALIYNNNVLENCTIQSIDYQVETQDRAATQFILSSFGIVVRTNVYCNVATPAGVVTVFLMSEYDNNPAIPEASFVSPDKNTKASLWWGESMVETYWIWLAHDMDQQRTCSDDQDVCQGKIRKARFNISRPKNSTINDILDPHFLQMEWYLIYEKNDTDFGIYWSGKHESQYAYDFIQEGRYPSTWWAPAEKLAKSMWSTVLVDLGQSKPSNILLDDAKLQKFTSDFDQFDKHKLNIKRGPATHPYNSSLNLTGPLGTTPAMINTAYTCNVPQRKSAGVLVWLILLANLVFIQLAWKTFQLIVDAWLERRHKEAQYCAGCGVEKPGQGQSLASEHDGGDGSSTAAETDSQSRPLSGRTRSLIVSDIKRSKTA